MVLHILNKRGSTIHGGCLYVKRIVSATMKGPYAQPAFVRDVPPSPIFTA